MFKFLGKIALVIGVGLGVAACGQKVEVPAAHVGKIMTKDGYKPEVIPTSKFRLDPCIAYCDELIVLNAADQAVTEPMRLLMPKDKLNMDFVVQATLSVKNENIDNLFSSISPSIKENKTQFIPISRVYETYAQQIIRAEAREFLSNYTIEEISSNLEAVNAQLSKKLSESINKRTPFSVRYVGISDLKYPNIITEAQENSAKRTEMIRQENAQLELSKVQLERELQEQKMQRAIDVERAEAEAQVNKIVSSSMTDRYVQYKQLGALELMAKSDNKVFVPMKMLDSVASQVQLGRN